MYTIVIKRSALKELAQISSPFKQKLIETIDALAFNPRPAGVKKLKGEEGYRVRIGDYRIVYTIEDVVKVVEVQRVRHRNDAYKK